MNNPQASAAVPAGSDADPGVIDGLLRIDSLDKRTRGYRRYVAIRDAVYSDLGGDEHLSEVQRQLADRFATLALWCESETATALAGGTIDADLYGRISGHVRRIGETLGVGRHARDVTPSLREYLAHKSRVVA